MFDRAYGPFFASKLVTSTAIWLTNVVSAILMYELTRSAIMVGAVSMAQFLPQTLLAPWAGALSDRHPRRAVLGASKLLTSGSLLTLAALIRFDGVEALAGGLLILVATAIIGVGLALANPAMQAIIPSLVSARDLPVAVALNSTTAAIARAVGPALGALLYAGLGPAAGYTVAAAGHVLFVITVLWIIHIPSVDAATERSVWAGLRYAWSHREMRALLLGVAVIGIVVDPVITLTPPLADALGASEVLVGVMASAFGIGSFLSITVFAAIRRRVGIAGVGATGFFLLASGNAVLVVIASPALSVLGMFIAGTGFLLATSSLTTRIQLIVPEQLRGRVMALWGVAFLGTRPFAAAVNGLVADVASLHVGFGLTAALALGAAVTLVRHTARTSTS